MIHPQHEFNDFPNDQKLDDPVQDTKFGPIDSINDDVGAAEEGQYNQFDDEIVGDDM